MNRAELLEKAQAQGLNVNSRTTKTELESMLQEKNTDSGDNVRVNENQDGEATNGTMRQGNESPVNNTTSVPQNGVTEVQTLDVTDDEVAKRADAARTEEDVKFSDESNPNLKARDAGAPGEEYDQDGNPRTGGYSYGVAPDDTTGTVPNKENEGTNPNDLGDRTDMQAVRAESTTPYLNPVAGSEDDTNANEWTKEDIFKEEEALSDRESGVSARLSTSAGNYVKVKFFYNNKPLGTYKSRQYKVEDAKKYLADLREQREI